MRSAVPQIFYTQAKNPQTDGAKNRTLHSSLRAVINFAASDSFRIIGLYKYYYYYYYYYDDDDDDYYYYYYTRPLLPFYGHYTG